VLKFLVKYKSVNFNQCMKFFSYCKFHFSPCFDNFSFFICSQLSFLKEKCSLMKLHATCVFVCPSQSYLLNELRFF
jgi:hypothetical protein